MMTLDLLLSETVRFNASDLHLLVGFPPTLRVDGVLLPVEGTSALTPQQVQELVFSVLSPELKDQLAANREVDFSLSGAGNRFRVNIYNQQNTLAGAFRLIPSRIRTIEELGLPKICHLFVKLRQGFVLVTGPTGHGKSTTLAAMIDEINQNKALNIITIEDPIEYVYGPGRSIVSQREMHTDTHSWNMSLRSVLREDPDVVLIGEMRDFETIQAAITIAETGHLVFATLHTNSASQTIDRIVDVFPDNQQAQVRLQLSSVLEGIISQRLLPAIGGGRTVITELLTATPAVRTTVREGKTHLIDNIIQTSGEMGMMTLEMSLAEAVKNNKIQLETARTYSLHPEELERLMRSQWAAPVVGKT